ncbi:MAG: hypothetical protein HQL19_07345 [Candidatus Omnitrophica bacterium]|nr:hypothetical protein [Candidatus Omnitrophota bacterium]
MAKVKQDPQFEIAFFENVLKHSPDFIEALVALGDLYTTNGSYAKGLAVDEKLARLRPDDGTILYNLACSYSLLADMPKARRTMEKAFACGYDDFLHLEKDTDLMNLMLDDEFVVMLKNAKSRRPQRPAEAVEDGR